MSRSVPPVSCFAPPGPGDRRPQIGDEVSDPVLRFVNIRLQMMVADVVDRVDGADEPVEFEKSLAERMALRQGAQLPDKGALGHLFEAQSGYDPFQIFLLRGDQLAVDQSGGPQRAVRRRLAGGVHRCES